MTDVYSLAALIREHQASLQFSRLTGAGLPDLDTGTLDNYWIGEYTPEQPHALDIVGRDKLSLFESAVRQGELYLPRAHPRSQPDTIIFADDVRCNLSTLTELREHALAVLQSTFSVQTILRTLGCSLAEQGTHQTQHGVMLSVCGEGILLRGKSGLGKSAIALELIARGHRLVADDAPLLHRLPGGGQVFALCPPILADLLEVRALGMLNVSKLFGPQASLALMPVDLVIELVEDFQATAEQRLQPFIRCTNILGVDIPHLPIPIGHATNPALIVETVTRNHVLYKEGYDAGASFIARQQQLLQK
jgi:HPr kinase/phosphorylase